jgi:hypothetical protein
VSSDKVGARGDCSVWQRYRLLALVKGQHLVANGMTGDVRDELALLLQPKQKR